MKYCSSLIITDYAETPVMRLGPPVTSCYSCGRNLIRNHVTKIKCYSTIGVKGGQKVTLRCKECQVSYNYSKFGNKHENGFRHYSSAQPYIEASYSGAATLLLQHMCILCCCMLHASTPSPPPPPTKDIILCRFVTDLQ